MYKNYQFNATVLSLLQTFFDSLNGDRFILGFFQPDSAAQLNINGHVLGSAPINLNEWLHIAGTYDGLMMKIYINGIVSDSLTVSTTINVAESDLYIGNDAAAGSREFDGLIDEVRIWDVARNGQEIAENMNKKLTGTEFGLAGYWPFDEGAGQTVMDLAFDSDGQLGLAAYADSTDPVWVKERVPKYVLLADDDIDIDRQLFSAGDIHSNDSIEFDDGNPSTHTGNLTAVDDIEIDGDNTIEGDVTAGDEVDNDGIVTGLITEDAEVDSVFLPTLSFVAGGDDIDVPDSGVQVLTPGSYGDVDVDDDAILQLSSGEYFMEILELDEDTILELDVAEGPITINVTERLEFKKRMQVQIFPDGEAGTHKITFNYLGTRKVKIDRNAKVLGSIVVPAARVKVDKYVSFKGSICARKIQIKRDGVFLHHTSTMALPKIALALDDAEEVADGAAEAMPQQFSLKQNFPNPFNPETSIQFDLPEAENVLLQIFNTRGQLVRTLVNKPYTAGTYNVRWDGQNDVGHSVASGLYLYKLKAGDFVQVQKMSLLR